MKFILSSFTLVRSTHAILICIAFCLPLNKVFVPIGIAMLVLISVITFIRNNYAYNLPKHKILLLPILFYGLHIISFFILKNKSSAFDLELKLSFLVLPICFIINTTTLSVSLKKIAIAFVAGCVVASVLCLLYAIPKYLITQSVDAFFYGELSYFHHPSYYAMYMCVALYIVGYSLHINYTQLFWPKIALLIYISTLILILNSKAGIVVLFVLMLIGAYYLLYLKQTLSKTLIILCIGSVSIITLIYNSNSLSYRIKEGYYSLMKASPLDQSQYLPSTTMRKVIWHDALTLIKEKPLGYGTGNVNTALATQYIKSGNTQAAQKQLNAHNQYLQTTLALGIIGGIVLLLLLFYPLGVLSPETKTMYAFLIGIVGFNLLTEAMFETQSGVVFFVFMYCILVTQRYNQLRITN